MNSRKSGKLTSEDTNRVRGLKHILNEQVLSNALGDDTSSRYCKHINNSQLVWMIVGFGLFASKSYENLFRLLVKKAGQLMPDRATICLARKRIAADVMERIHDAVVAMLAVDDKACPSAYHHGMKLMGVDGYLLNLHDNDANRKVFGRPSNQTSPGAFPKARIVSLCELGTRVLFRSVIGGYHNCEQKLVRSLFDFLNTTTLLLADRHFGIGWLLVMLIKRRVPFLVRAKKSHSYPVKTRLSDGSYLSEVYANKKERASRKQGKKVRVIRYTLNDPHRTGKDEVHVLLTTLLNEKKHPAKTLVCLYHERWEEEIAIGEAKVTLHNGRVLRSQTPEGVRQEIWGLLLAHFIVRKLIFDASQESEQPPRRLSFTSAVNILEIALAETPTGPRRLKWWLRDLISEIAQTVMSRRQNRINPRVVKKRSKARKTKKDHHRKPPPPNPIFADTIEMSI